MFNTRMALPRRTFLRGMGVTLALPLLDAMVPASSALAKTAARPVRRLGFVYIPNGAVMSHWQPEGEGALETLPPTLSPLAPFQDQVIADDQKVASDMLVPPDLHVAAEESDIASNRPATELGLPLPERRKQEHQRPQGDDESKKCQAANPAQ